MFSIRLEGLTHEFEDREVFGGLDYEFAGSCLAVTGPNGSGKSTLLRVLSGLLSPSFGNAAILVDGAEVPRDAARALVGLSASNVRLYPELTVRENLLFLISARGLRDMGKVDSALDEVGLLDRADDLVCQLSAGLQQRASLASALVHGPRVLLLDEPTANLDERGVQMVRALVESRRREGGVVIATNDAEEAALGEERLDLGSVT